MKDVRDHIVWARGKYKELSMDERKVLGSKNGREESIRK